MSFKMGVSQGRDKEQRSIGEIGSLPRNDPPSLHIHVMTKTGNDDGGREGEAEIAQARTQRPGGKDTRSLALAKKQMIILLDRLSMEEMQVDACPRRVKIQEGTEYKEFI